MTNASCKENHSGRPNFQLGFGGASMGNLYRAISDEAARETILAAWDSGFRYFDTAPYYGLGLSERRIGDVLRHVPRDAFDVSTKVGRILEPDITVVDNQLRYGFASSMPFRPRYDYSYDGFMRSYAASLQRLGLARIDTLFVHDIGTATHGADNDRYFKDLANSGYKALEELRRAGDIKAVGLGVNEWEVCEEAMKIGQFDCFLLAGRYTLLEQFALESFFPKCLEHDASIILGGAYNSGILATGVKGKRVGYYNYEPAPDTITERVRQIEEVAQSHTVTLAAAALQFPLAHEVVASVIPGIGSAARVGQTLSLYNEDIPPAFWNDLRTAELISPAAPTPTGRSAGCV